VVLGLICSALTFPVRGGGGLLLIFAGSWPSTEGRVRPGLAALVTRAAGAAVSRPTL
jgi:hypothetical protein